MAGALLLLLLHRALHPGFWRGLAILACLSALVLAAGRLGQPGSTGFLPRWDLWAGVLSQPSFRDGPDSRPFVLFVALMLVAWAIRRSLADAEGREVTQGLAVGAATLFFIEADDPTSVALAWGGLDLVLLAIGLSNSSLRDSRLVRDGAAWSVLGLGSWLGAALLAPHLHQAGLLRAVAIWIRLGLFPAHSFWLMAGRVSPGPGGLLPILLVAAGGGLLVREGWPVLREPYSPVLAAVAAAAVGRGLLGMWRRRETEEGLEWIVQSQIGWWVLALAAGGTRIETLTTPYLLWLILALGLMGQSRPAPAMAAPGLPGSTARWIWVVGAAVLLPAPPLPSAVARGLAYLHLAELGSGWVVGAGILVSLVSLPILADRFEQVPAAPNFRRSARAVVGLLPPLLLVASAVLAPLWMGGVPIAGTPLAAVGEAGWWMGWTALLLPLMVGYGLHRYRDRLPVLEPAQLRSETRRLWSLPSLRWLESIWTGLARGIEGGEMALEGRHLTGWLLLGALAVLILLLG